MTTRLQVTRTSLPRAEPPSQEAFQVVVESCVYLESSGRFLPERALERKGRLRSATLYKARPSMSARATRQQVA